MDSRSQHRDPTGSTPDVYSLGHSLWDSGMRDLLKRIILNLHLHLPTIATKRVLLAGSREQFIVKKKKITSAVNSDSIIRAFISGERFSIFGRCQLLY